MIPAIRRARLPLARPSQPTAHRGFAARIRLLSGIAASARPTRSAAIPLLPTPALLARHRHLATAVEHTPSSALPIMPGSASLLSALSPIPPIPTAPDHTPLVLPPTEDRPHAFFTLPNGLEAIVVSDPTTEKSAAAMCVGVGHLSDPADLPGCAHFCEHLLFMGTKKYPKENDYNVYLTENNGHSNAWTAMTETVYFFDVDSRKLEGALDRFSGFFQEPLFNEDCTEREIQAVDSEHKKNLQNDMWRMFQLEKHLSRPDHAYNKFGTGDYNTLWSQPKKDGRDPRKQLMDWWAKEYCARRMKLVIVGRESVEELEKMIRERFEGVPVRTEGSPEVGEHGRKVAFLDSPMGPEEIGKVTFARPVRDNRGLEITFPVPDIQHLYQSKPLSYISHFIGHEGRGSLQSYLKKEGWINVLRAGPFQAAAGFDFLKISVDLTPTGLENWQKVALAIFKYTNMLRSAPLSSVAFNERKQIGEISFKFAEKMKAWHYVTMLAAWMQHSVPRDKIVSSNWLLEQFREDEIRATMELLDARQAAIGVNCKDLPKDVSGSWDQNEPIYGTEYKRIKLSEEFLAEATSGAPIPDFVLPGPNDYIAERLDVEKFSVDMPALRPAMLRDTAVSRLWYKRDDRFWLPKTYVNLKLRSPLFNATPRNSVLSSLLADVFNDSTAEDTYDASLAELSFHLAHHGTNLSIQAAGFSDKLPRLLEDMLRKLVDFQVDPQRFANLVDDLKLSWENFPLNEPYKQASYWKAFSSAEAAWTHRERLAELEFVKPEDVAVFGKEVLLRLHVETLIHGNTTQAEAEKLQDMVESVLRPRALTPTERTPSRSLLLPQSTEHVWTLPVSNASEVNNCVVYWMQVSTPVDRPTRVALQLYAQIAQEPTFNQLRTKEQLGYITQSGNRQQTGQMDFQVLVQSERDPVYVETRIEAFLDSMRAIIAEMSQEEFDKYRESVIAKHEEKPKNLSEETRRFWGSIGNHYYEFGGRETDVANLRKLSKQDLLDLHDKYISTSSPERTKLSVHMKSQCEGKRSALDAASAGPLLQAMQKHGVPVNKEEMAAFMGTNPTLQAVKDLTRQAIGALTSLADEAKKELEGLVEGLKEKAGPNEGEDDKDGAVRLREKNVVVQDIQAFKAGLIPSAAPVPLEPLRPEQARL